MSLSPGEKVHMKGMHQEYRVLAETEGGRRVWLMGEEFMRWHGGLVWHGKRGDAWADSMSPPFLAEVDGVEAV